MGLMVFELEQKNLKRKKFTGEEGPQGKGGRILLKGQPLPECSAKPLAHTRAKVGLWPRPCRISPFSRIW